jgi:hypothetical protein
MSKTRTTITGKKTTYINILNKLPIDGGKAVKVPVNEFIKQAQKQGNSLEEWSEEVSYISEKEVKFEVTDTRELNDIGFNDRKLNSYVDICAENLNKLAICYMDDLVKYGVFALQDFKKGDPIAICTGPYVITTESRPPAFLANSDYLTGNRLYRGYYCWGNFQKKGNIARFIQHAYNYNEESLEFFKFKEKDNVVTANCNLLMRAYKEYPFGLIVANQNIRKKQMLCYSYSENYWAAKSFSPRFFDAYGRIIDSSQYEITNYHVDLLPIPRLGDFHLSQDIPAARLKKIITTETPIVFTNEMYNLTASAALVSKALQECVPGSRKLTIAMTPSNEAYQKYVCDVLNNITGLKWTCVIYGHDKKVACVQSQSEDIYRYLSLYLKVQKKNDIADPKRGLWAGTRKQLMMVHLNSPNALEKLSNIPQFMPPKEEESKPTLSKK